MSRRSRFLIFIAFSVVAVSLFLELRGPSRPRNIPPIVGGDELKPGEKVYVDGRISLANPITFPRESVLEISIRESGAGHRVVALRRMESPSFPLRLFITSADKVSPQASDDGALQVHAHVSWRGNPEVSERDDWEGTLDFKKGTNDRVELVLKPVSPS